MGAVKQCPHCGQRKSVGSFQKTGAIERTYERCYDCRYARKTIPQPTDPVRKRECWECSKEFVTTDFTERLCSPVCRARRRNRQDKDPITGDDQRAITRAMKKIGLHRRSTIKFGTGESEKVTA